MSLYPPSNYDSNQVLQYAFDESTQRLRTDATIDGEFAVELDATDDSVRLGDGTNLNTMTTVGSKKGIDVNVIGNSGLSGSLKSQAITVTDVAAKIPTSALSGRNTITIRIKGSSTVYFGASDVTSTNGYFKNQNEELVLDIKDTMDVYAVCASGQTSEIRILEIA